MAKKPTTLESVEVLKHDEAKRRNIPTTMLLIPRLMAGTREEIL